VKRDEESAADALGHVASIDEVLVAQGQEIASIGPFRCGVSPRRNRGVKWSRIRRYVTAAAWWNSSIKM
jgi:hypothetical protein